MGIFNRFGHFLVNLTENDRETIWQQLGSFTANSLSMKGNKMIQNSYDSNIDVYSIIKKIIDITKSVPWVVEQYTGGRWKIITDTSIHELMDNPNMAKGYTWNDIEEQLLIYLLCTGNAYVHSETQFNRTLIEELDILPSSFICIEPTSRDFFLPEYYYRFNIDGSNKAIDKEKISHIKFFNPGYSSIKESLYGLSPIQVAARAIQAGNDRWDADNNLMQNRGALGLITDKSNRPMSEPEADAVQKSFDRDTAGTRNFGKVKVTNKDLNYIQMAMSPADLQLLEKGVINLRAICNVFGLDSSLFNDPENKTYSNRTEAEKSMFTNAVMPISDKIAEHLTRFLCPNHFPGKKIRLRQDFSNIEVLQENFKEKSEVFALLKNSGIITANTAAEALKQPKSTDPNADLLIITANSQLLNSLGNQNNNSNFAPNG